MQYALLEKLRPFISNIARNSIEEERDNIVSDILESMRTHDMWVRAGTDFFLLLLKLPMASLSFYVIGSF